MASRKPVVLAIFDGWGIALPSAANAISRARTPHLDALLKKYIHTELEASSVGVGLPNGQPGNSEAGHMNIGAGRVVEQDSVRINKEIESGAFEKNTELVELLEDVQRHNSKLHLVGLLSDTGTPHSYPLHVEALLKLAKKYGLQKVYLHLFTDGRDSDPQGALNLLRNLSLMLTTLGVGEIATISGRYYGMDRASHWERIQKVYDAMVWGRGETSILPYQAVDLSYMEGLYDEFVSPTVIIRDNAPVATVEDNDGVLYFNLRSDRGRELTQALTNTAPLGMLKTKPLRNVHVLTLTEFGTDLPVSIAYPAPYVTSPLPEVLSDLPNFKQLYIAESEKFAHVTYFFNGGRYVHYPNATFVQIPSPNVATYDLQPEMSAYEITDHIIDSIWSDTYDFIVANFANADMVGHTGSDTATVRAVEVLDECIGKIAAAVESKSGILAITADHGKADVMVNIQTDTIVTMHTTNPVPFVLVGSEFEEKGLCSLMRGTLSSVATTLLEIMHIAKPAVMTSPSLLRRK